MEESNKKDLKINGIMSLPGGSYNNVKVNGHLDLTSEIDCNEIHINGMLTVSGKVKAGKAKVHGSSSFKDDVEFDSFTVLGKADVTGEAKIKELKIEGQMSFSKNLQSESVTIYGETKVKGNCDAETFKTKGAFTIDGMLNAGIIEIKLHGKCSANEIGGENIKVYKGTDYYFKKIIKSIFSTNIFDSKLIANVIEGDDIYLESTKAKIVRGDSVEIGPNCEIDVVEFKNKFRKNENSVVKENRKV